MAVRSSIRRIAVKILTTSDNPVAVNCSLEQSCSTPTWQHHMKSAIRSTEKLLDAVELGHLLEGNTGIPAGAKQFPVFVPLPFLNRIKKGDLEDPLLKQVLPVTAEDHSPDHFSKDPLGEQAATVRDGLLQKYRKRVLVISSSACAINCRYCFRRHFPYQTSTKGDAQWDETIAKIAGDPTVNEVILSGGDPLTVADEKLETVIRKVAAIEHVKRLRIHSRLPIVIPQRVTRRLLETFDSFRDSCSDRQTVFVVHCNHANEIDGDVAQSLKQLRGSCTQLLNQSVLLLGVNDSEDALVDLSERLMACGALPYYLHQLDPIEGASHFEVDPKKGLALIEAIRARLPGFGVPRYVQEIAGEPNKTVLA